MGASSGVAGQPWNIAWIKLGIQIITLELYKRKSKWYGRKSLEYVWIKYKSSYHFRI